MLPFVLTVLWYLRADIESDRCETKSNIIFFSHSISPMLKNDRRKKDETFVCFVDGATESGAVESGEKRVVRARGRRKNTERVAERQSEKSRGSSFD